MIGRTMTPRKEKDKYPGYFWCFHCEQCFQPSMSNMNIDEEYGDSPLRCEIRFETRRCSGHFGDFREWKELRELHSDYPEVPEPGVCYSLW